MLNDDDHDDLTLGMLDVVVLFLPLPFIFLPLLLGALACLSVSMIPLRPFDSPAPDPRG